MNLDPENPDINFELARYYSQYEDTEGTGKKYYLDAARNYYLKRQEKGIAGNVFLEYLMRYKEPAEPEIHLKYANTLSNVCDYYGAARILEPIINKDDLTGVMGQRIFLDFISFAAKAGLKEPAEYAYKKFKKIFPDTIKIREAESLMRSSAPEIKPELRIEKSSSADTWGLAVKEIVDSINEITSNLYFWIIFVILIKALLTMFIFTGLRDLLDIRFITLSAIIAFIVTLVAMKIVSFYGSIYEGRNSKDEIQGLRKFNISFFMDKARACEREEKFDEAARYLEAVIEEDKDNLWARYMLARLYHKKLSQSSKAIREYKIILQTAPQSHPIQRDAYQGIKELSQSDKSRIID